MKWSVKRAEAPVQPDGVIQMAALQTLDGEQDEAKKRALDLKVSIHRALLDKINLSALEQMPREQIRTEISEIIGEILLQRHEPLNRSERTALIDDVLDELLGLGPLEPLLQDDSITDILVNGPDIVFVERNGLLERVQTEFQNDKHLMRIIQKIVSAVGRRIDESSPFVDARLADGSRVNAIVSPLAVDGSLLSIRKFAKKRIGIDRLIELGSVPEPMAQVLRAVVASRRNVLISGGTGSGKTTLLNAMSSYIDPRERIVTIEDSAELQLQQEHVARLETRPANVEGKGEVTQRELVKNALRMRPDRIIVGEVRAGEAFDMLQAMNTGHDGSMTTIHANSARDATSRLENMVALAGIEIPLAALRRQIASAVNLVVQVNRMQDGSRKITSITEITGCENDVLSMQELFAFDHMGISPDDRVEGRFISTGVRSHFSDRFRRWGHELPGHIYQSDAP